MAGALAKALAQRSAHIQVSGKNVFTIFTWTDLGMVTSFFILKKSLKYFVSVSFNKMNVLQKL